jgi:hypothetical protein
MVVPSPVVLPEGLKPFIPAALFGPAKAVPLLQNWFLKHALNTEEEG